MDENNYYSAILQNNTFSGLIVGQKIVVLKQIDSTNNFLKNELSKSAPLTEGTVIMAEEQFAGRGQMENKWISEPGLNLTFSILLCPTFLSPEVQCALNVAISLAINDALSPIIGDGLKIKWPNDIYVNDQKLGGVLIENILRGRRWKYAVVGIGLNVNQINFVGVGSPVISLKKILHQDYDLKKLLLEICEAVSFRYHQLREGNKQHLEEYLKNLYRFNEFHTYCIDGIERPASIVGVDERGMLKLMVDGRVYRYGLKEVGYIIR